MCSEQVTNLMTQSLPLLTNSNVAIRLTLSRMYIIVANLLLWNDYEDNYYEHVSKWELWWWLLVLIIWFLQLETTAEESYICNNFNNFENRDEWNANVQSQCALLGFHAAQKDPENPEPILSQSETVTPTFESKLQMSYFGDSMINCLFNSS